MKIVKRGQETYVCPRCGCEFQIENENDINRFDCAVNDGGFFGIFPLIKSCVSCRCPQCGEKVILEWL